MPRLQLSIATKITLPWVLLLIMVLGLVAVHRYQTIIDGEREEQSNLHRQAVLLAQNLRYLAQERWAKAQFYRTSQDTEIKLWLPESYGETDREMNKLSGLFAVSKETGKQPNHDDTSVLDSYKVASAGHAKLYAQFMAAVDLGDREQQERMQALLGDKVRLVLATLDDLNQYHLKTERIVEADRLAESKRTDEQLYGLLGLLIVAGLILSRFQTRGIAKPLAGLTGAARQIEKGQDADLVRFRGDDEIGQLSGAIAAMVTELKRASTEILSKNALLEKAYAEIEVNVQQRTRELKHRTEELETAIRDLEGFSYSVSHDLRAPLRAIDGFVAILLEEYGDKLDAEGQRLFGIVRDNARKMGQLIDDILAFSRAGRLEISLRLVDMNALADESWNALAEGRGERPIEFRREELPPIICDARAIRQVWQNLFDNAIKFTRGRTPAVIEVTARQECGNITYSVRDNGVGFNPAYSDKLYGLFQRLHGMDEFEGTGVGLCLVKRFVQKHHGTVLGIGQVNGGATFSFTLPAAVAIQEEL